MGLLDRFRVPRPEERYAASVAPGSDSYALQALKLPEFVYGRPEWPLWSPDDAAATGYRRLALVFRCVNIVAHALGTAPVRVYDENRDGATIPGHPLSDLMRRPNRMMGSAAFWSHVGVRTATAGFCLVEKERDGTGRPIGLWPLVSSWCTKIERRGSPPDWRYRPGGTGDGVVIRAEDVIVFTWADAPSGTAYGASPLEACMREVAVANTMTDFLKRFLDVGAVPMIGLVPDVWPGQTLSQTQVEAIEEGFARRHLGADNAARPVVLHAIKEIKQLGLDMNQMAYADLRDLTELAIVQAFGIPASVAQIRVGLEHSDSRANAEVDEGKFYRQTILPLWTRFDDRLTLDLLPDFDLRPNISLEFDTSDISALQENRNEKATWANAAVSGGWLSVHAWHREMGLPVPAGEDYYLRSIAVTPVPASTPLQDSGALPTGETEEEQQAGTTIREIASGLPSREEVLSAYWSPRPVVRDRLSWTGPESWGSGDADRYARVSKDRALIARIANARVRSIERFFEEQAERIIPLIFEGLSGSGPEETYALESVDWDAEDRVLRGVLERLYLLAGRTAFQAAKDHHGITVGVAFDLANPDVKNLLNVLGFKVRGIGETTRADIERTVLEGLNSGLRAEAIQDNLRGMFVETYKNRALTIARTESMHAYGEASVLGYQKSGVVDRAEIFDNPTHTEDYGASDGLTCATRDGIVVPLANAMDHVYADHPNGSATVAPVLVGDD